MNYLLDTCTLSETAKPAPNPGWQAWIGGVSEAQLYTSVITWVELRYGTAKLPPGARRSKLEGWISSIRERFADRLLPIELVCAEACGELMASSKALGRPIGDMDALIAATALVHGMTLVTRNVSDFAGAGIRILNPWT